MAQRRPREVLTTPQFDAQAKAIQSDVKRFDELFTGIEWTIARSQYEGPVVLRADLGTNGPRVEVRAEVEEKQALLTGIRIILEE